MVLAEGMRKRETMRTIVREGQEKGTPFSLTLKNTRGSVLIIVTGIVGY